MKKRLVGLLLVAVMALSLVACQKAETKGTAAETANNGSSEEVETATEAQTEEAVEASAQTASGLPKLAKDEIKVGFIFGSIGDEGYNYAHNLGRLALEKEGIKTLYVENVPETSDCEKAARDLIEQGCNVIYAVSFGYGQWIQNVADEYPDVYFNHATGDVTKTNMSTYAGRMYEPQYLAGIAAGLKTTSNKIGYVVSFPIPEVIQQVDAFTLGVRSVNPNATVEVKWTNSWYDPVAEKSASTELLNTGCDVINAYLDTLNAQIAASEAGAFAIGCSSPGYDKIPKAYLTAAIYDTSKFYTANIQSIIDGTWTSEGQWLGLDSGMVAIDEITPNSAQGTQEAVDKAKAAIIDGSLKIFSGEIKDNEGNVKVAAGQTLSDEELAGLNFFVDGVIGSIDTGN